MKDSYQWLLLAQFAALLTLLSHGLIVSAASPGNIPVAVPTSVPTVSRRSRSWRGFGWFRSTTTTITTTTPRTLVQQVHLPNVDLAKLLTVAKLDLRERRRIGNHNCTIIDECVTLTSGKYFPVASCASLLELNGGHLLEKDKQGRHYLELSQVETTVQCLLSWISVWTLSCREYI